MVGPVGHPERDALDALDEVVDRFGRSVRVMAAMLRGDRLLPADDRAAEAPDFGRARVVLEVDTELGDEHRSGVRVADLVDRAQDLLGVPGHAHLTARIASAQQALEPVVAIRAEALVCDRQQPAGAVERIVAAAAMTQRVVLDAAADLVEDTVRELDQMERVRDLGGVREHRVEHAAIRTRQIKVAQRIAVSHTSGR